MTSIDTRSDAVVLEKMTQNIRGWQQVADRLGYSIDNSMQRIRFATYRKTNTPIQFKSTRETHKPGPQTKAMQLVHIPILSQTGRMLGL